MARINEGYIITPRVILKSEIWKTKPAWWLKIWNFILIKVNHKDNKYFKRGTNLFTYEMIHYECNLNLDFIKSKSISNVIKWLKLRTQITTQKTTRGLIITVCNYELYQNPKNYVNDTENDT